MITHLVLFRPRANLAAAEGHALADALMTVLQEVPAIRRVRVGSRVRAGRAYEALMRTNYPYAAFLEFDDLDGLHAYLDHPAHGQLAERFFAAFEEALMYDFEMEEGAEGIRRMLSA